MRLSVSAVAGVDMNHAGEEERKHLFGDVIVPSTASLFRHLLEKHRLPDCIFGEVKKLLTERGLLMSAGTIVDATIINAPSSTKNEKKERDPEMHQTKKATSGTSA
jgi:IS5 family transposase